MREFPNNTSSPAATAGATATQGRPELTMAEAVARIRSSNVVDNAPYDFGGDGC
jgi:hypothetical protein